MRKKMGESVKKSHAFKKKNLYQSARRQNGPEIPKEKKLVGRIIG